jgi:hypothetical protein
VIGSCWSVMRVARPASDNGHDQRQRPTARLIVDLPAQRGLVTCTMLYHAIALQPPAGPTAKITCGRPPNLVNPALRQGTNEPLLLLPAPRPLSLTPHLLTHLLTHIHSPCQRTQWSMAGQISLPASGLPSRFSGSAVLLLHTPPTLLTLPVPSL